MYPYRGMVAANMNCPYFVLQIFLFVGHSEEEIYITMCWTPEMTQSRMPRGLIGNEQLRYLASQPCYHEWEYHKCEISEFTTSQMRRIEALQKIEQPQLSTTTTATFINHRFNGTQVLCHDGTSSYATRLYQDRSLRGGVLRKRGLCTSIWLRVILTNLWT